MYYIEKYFVLPDGGDIIRYAFSGSFCYFAQHLSTCIVGASLTRNDEDEEEKVEDDDKETYVPPVDQVYQIIGTLKFPSRDRPKFVKDEVPVS